MKQSERLKAGIEYTGSIGNVRAVEDCIRATKKYTKGAFAKPAQHPIQGEAFPSKVLVEYYEVYPDTELRWDMPAGVAIDWLWGDVPCIDVLFKYDYRANKASVIVRDGLEAIEELSDGIPGFRDTLEMVTNGKGKLEPGDRNGT